jgi:hypothetical protein
MKKSNMLTATLVALAFAIAPLGQASPDGGPVDPRTAPAPRERPTPAPRPNSGFVNLSADEASRAVPTPRARPTAAERPNDAVVALGANEDNSANTEARPAYSEGPADVQMPVITIHPTDNVTRGKIGSFVLNMSPALMLGGMYVNFSVSGSAVPGVDYVPLISPAYIGGKGYGTILIQTLPDPRGSANRQSYSVVVTLKPGAGYAVGAPGSATMWIKP